MTSASAATNPWQRHNVSLCSPVSATPSSALFMHTRLGRKTCKLWLTAEGRWQPSSGRADPASADAAGRLQSAVGALFVCLSVRLYVSAGARGTADVIHSTKMIPHLHSPVQLHVYLSLLDATCSRPSHQIFKDYNARGFDGVSAIRRGETVIDSWLDNVKKKIVSITDKRVQRLAVCERHNRKSSRETFSSSIQ